jgi:hypothetical protein
MTPTDYKPGDVLCFPSEEVGQKDRYYRVGPDGDFLPIEKKEADAHHAERALWKRLGALCADEMARARLKKLKDEQAELAAQRHKSLGA